jgi:hypothetical protein
MGTRGMERELAGVSVAAGIETSLAQESPPGPGVDFVFNGE